jgi:hypothetical protein
MSENVSDIEDSYKSTLPPDSDYRSEDWPVRTSSQGNFDGAGSPEAGCELNIVKFGGIK